MTTEEQVEKVAQAIYEASLPKGGRNYAAWEDLDSLGYETNRENCERYARAAIAVMEPELAALVAERDALWKSLVLVLLDVCFMMEEGLAPDRRDDDVYQNARAVLDGEY